MDRNYTNKAFYSVSGHKITTHYIILLQVLSLFVPVSVIT